MPAKAPAKTTKTSTKTAPKTTSKAAPKASPKAVVKAAPKAKADTGKKAWVVTADMGLGHQRAAYPLSDIADEGVLTIGASSVTSEKEKKLWDRLLGTYEFASRLRKVPLIGKPIFRIIDKLQEIKPYYPKRDLSKPDYPGKMMNNLAAKGLGKDLLDKCKQKPANPFISTFYTPGYSAVHQKYPGKKYIILTDADVARAWVPDLDPKKTQLNFLTPSDWVSRRMEAYGVPASQIFQTGFPMPKEIIGKNLEILKADLGRRLHQLDPQGVFLEKHGKEVEQYLGKSNIAKPSKPDPLSITFCVGGAGAQKEIGIAGVKSLIPLIKAGKVTFTLVAGVRKEVRDYFYDSLKKLKILSLLDNQIKILYSPDKREYFRMFNEQMKTTGVLWTKPSELTFYTGLGIPLCIAPPIGAQERFNQGWLIENHAGFDQQQEEYIDQWLIDLRDKGHLAEVAWSAFMNIPKMGTYNIEELITTGKISKKDNPLLR